MDALLYGANGYTGRLIAAVAKREGLPLTLAGRRREAVEPLARELGLPWKAFALDDRAALVRQLEPYGALVLAAGPFSATSRAAFDACLAARTAYLDITGEIDVFESLFARGEEAWSFPASGSTSSRPTAWRPRSPRRFPAPRGSCWRSRVSGARPER
jgi:short subunit dehydrogenase-like uncharacterized protein